MDPRLLDATLRIADALERLAPPPPPVPDLTLADAFVWQPEGSELRPVARVSRVELDLLQGVDSQKALILATFRHYGQYKERTAAVLGISLKTLYNRLKEYAADGVEPGSQEQP